MTLSGSAAYSTLTVVLIKDFAQAKTRLSSRLTPGERCALARSTAVRALDAAVALGPASAVCGSRDTFDLARAAGADAILEPESRGQNAAAQAALRMARERNADSLLVLSSDLPLVTTAALDGMRRCATAAAAPCVVAAAAWGRGGTNAVFLQPLGPFTWHFGGDSLRRFEAEALRRRRGFITYRHPALALDLDEPTDLDRWEERRSA